jgi:hypothetical protein
MTAKRLDPMTAQPHDTKHPEPCALRLSSIPHPQSSLRITPYKVYSYPVAGSGTDNLIEERWWLDQYDQWKHSISAWQKKTTWIS